MDNDIVKLIFSDNDNLLHSEENDDNSISSDYSDMIILDSIEEGDAYSPSNYKTIKCEESDNVNENIQEVKNKDKAQFDTLEANVTKSKAIKYEEQLSSVTTNIDHYVGMDYVEYINGSAYCHICSPDEVITCVEFHLQSKEHLHLLKLNELKTPAKQPDTLSRLTSYKNVFVVGNPKCHPYLQQLATNDKVILKLNSCLTMEAVRKNFSDINANELEDTLWLLFFGIECVGSLKYWDVCEDNLCNHPLYQFHLNENLKTEGMKSVLTSTMAQLKSLETDLRSVVGPRSNVILMPFAPFIGDICRTHDTMHSGETTAFYIKEDNLNALQEVLAFCHENYSTQFCFQLNKNMGELVSNLKYASGIPALKTYIEKVVSFIEHSLKNALSITSHVAEPNARSSSTKSVELQHGRFRHVLIVGSPGLQRLCSLTECVNVSYITDEFPIKWEKLKKTLDNVQQDRKYILVVCVYDVSAIYIPKIVKGSNFSYFIPSKKNISKIDELIGYNIIIQLITNCTKYFGSQNNLLITPLLPRLVLNWPVTKEAQDSIIANCTFNSEHCPIYVQNLGVSFDLTNNQQFQVAFLAQFVYKLGNCSLDNLSMHTLPQYEDITLQNENLEVWRNYLIKSIKVYGEEQQQHISHTTQLRRDYYSPPNINHTQVPSTHLKKKKAIENSSGKEQCKRRKIAWTPPELLKTDLSVQSSCPNFIKNISELNKVVSFEHVYVIGTHRTINQLEAIDMPSKLNIPATFIRHKYTGSSTEQASIIKAKFGPHLEKSVCLLIFDIDYFFHIKTVDFFCKANGCRRYLDHLYIGDEILDNVELAANYTRCRSRIETAASLLLKLGTAVSCFPMPLAPYCLYCSFDPSDCHDIMHWLSEQCFLVVGRENYWDMYSNFVVDEWAKLMLTHYQNADIIHDVKHFIDSIRKTFYQIANDPWGISDQKDGWILHRDIINQLLTWIMIPKNLLESESNVSVDGHSDDEIIEITELKVWNLSKAIKPAFISDIIRRMGQVSQFKSNSKGSFSAFLPLRKAKLVEMKLNNLRIANNKLRAECTEFKDFVVEFKESEFQQMNVIFAEEYIHWKENVSRELLFADTAPVVDIVTFKTLCCNGCCGNQALCQLSHGPWDLRRNPLTYSYSNMMCPAVVKGLCPKGFACQYSHNSYECQYHPSTFQTRACSEQIAGHARCHKSFCESYHTNSREMIFTPEWENQITFGLDQTVKYFMTSVKSLRKLQYPADESTKILVLSSSLSFLEILKASYSSVFKTYQATCLIVNKDYINNRRNCSILMGTPILFSNMLHGLCLKISKVKLIIIDDFSSILEDKTTAQQMFVFLKQMKNVLNFANVALVVTVEAFDKKLPHIISRFFNASFNVIPPKELNQDSLVSTKVGTNRRVFPLTKTTADIHNSNLHQDDRKLWPQNTPIDNQSIPDIAFVPMTRENNISQYIASSRSRYTSSAPSALSVREIIGRPIFLPKAITMCNQAGD